MGSRIMTMKKQAVELGRIRTGYSVPNEDPKKRARAVRSETFIFTSHSRDYVAAAAEQWGGDVEPWTPQRSKIEQFRVITRAREIRAIMPSGDPLSQAYEMWGGGGCVRRCDGEREQKSGQPCICLARYGPKWHRRSPREVCRPTSRISVMLPELPDLGVWRLDTHSYYAADGMAGSVDTVLQATGGASMMPVRMWIEQTTRVENGETKNFPVVKLVPAVPQLKHALSGPCRRRPRLTQARSPGRRSRRRPLRCPTTSPKLAAVGPPKKYGRCGTRQTGPGTSSAMAPTICRGT